MAYRDASSRAVGSVVIIATTALSRLSDFAVDAAVVTASPTTKDRQLIFATPRALSPPPLRDARILLRVFLLVYGAFPLPSVVRRGQSASSFLSLE
ncbi:hypothetical protein HYQ46_001244 [Verticillium longisporum]|nr:hypothetical protein HYQ46_001244 [Verticillium longisporum]